MTDANPKPNVTNLPAFLEMTPDQIANSERIQEQVRQALHGRVQANQEEARLVRGIHAERAARATLEVIAAEKSHKGRAESAKLHLARLADAYADEGRYIEAALTHPIPERANEYIDIQAALDRPDDEMCDCPAREVKDPVSGQTLQIPVINQVENVYSTKLKRMVPLLRCDVCGHLNARRLPEVLARREQAMKATKPMTDLELLKIDDTTQDVLSEDN